MERKKLLIKFAAFFGGGAAAGYIASDIYYSNARKRRYIEERKQWDSEKRAWFAQRRTIDDAEYHARVAVSSECCHVHQPSGKIADNRGVPRRA